MRSPRNFVVKRLREITFFEWHIVTLFWFWWRVWLFSDKPFRVQGSRPAGLKITWPSWSHDAGHVFTTASVGLMRHRKWQSMTGGWAGGWLLVGRRLRSQRWAVSDWTSIGRWLRLIASLHRSLFLSASTRSTRPPAPWHLRAAAERLIATFTRPH